MTLLKKEISLNYLPIVWFFPLFSAMLLIPDYPYCVAIGYSIFSIFNTFNYGAGNGDYEYNRILPISKKSIVCGKFLSVLFLEFLHIFTAVVFALFSSLLIWKGNSVGLDANFSFFGVSFFALGLFNLVFLPLFFRRECKLGVAIMVGLAVYVLFVVVAELLIGVVPVLNRLFDGLGRDTMLYRGLLLLDGGIFFALANALSFRLSVKEFERV